MKGFVCLFASLVGLSCRGALPSIQGVDVVTEKPVVWAPGKHSVIVFLSPSCPCSISHEKSLEGLAKRFPKVAFVGVVSNAKGTTKEGKQHFKTAGLSFPVIQENGTQWADAFGALNTPHAFLVNPSGEIVFQGGVDDSRVAGRATQNYLQDALEAVTQGQPVRLTRARPLGCAIRHP